MKHIAIWNIPDDVRKKVQREAGCKGLSLNKAFISLLSRGVSVKALEKKKKGLHHDHFADLWSRKEDA